MDTYTVITPANIEVEYRLANAGSRLAAFVVDFLLQMLVILSIAAVALFGFAGLRFETLREANGPALAFVIIAAFVIQFGYFIVCELIMNGQSIGKRIFKLRVIRDNGLPVGFSQSLVRNLIRPAVDMLYIGLFVILFSKHHKRLGDFAAGTVVISEHPFPETPSVEHVTAEGLDFLPARLLTAEEKYWVGEWLRRKDGLPDGGEKIKRQLTDYFDVL